LLRLFVRLARRIALFCDTFHSLFGLFMSRPGGIALAFNAA
jgi:hypothetical protein